MLDPIHQFKMFLSKYGYTESDLDQLVSMCEVVEFKKGDIAIKAGVKQHQIFFICKGIVRNYIFTNDGQVKTNGFRMENMTSTGYSNYNYAEDLKAKTSVECLEDCIMIKIPFNAIQYMVHNSANSEKVGRLIAEHHVMELVDILIDMETKSLLERYYNLDKKFPNILQRVPQHIIASFLGTTPVHLSRIKNAKTGPLTFVNKFE